MPATLTSGGFDLLRAPGPSAWLGAATACAAAAVLRRLAPRIGLEDRGGGREWHRLDATPPKALIGGLALALGLAAALACDAWTRSAGAASAAGLGTATLFALGLATVVGLLDDWAREGFGAAAKLAWQVLPAAAFAWAVARGEGEFASGSYVGTDPLPVGAILALPRPALLALALCAALAAQNLANTWDNADGVLVSTAALALGAARPEWSLAIAPLLLFNLRARGAAPVLLGDSGSHLIALLILCEPSAWGAFVLPALDLARVFRLRAREGRPGWSGDRAHLAHRLQARGLAPLAVVATLCLAAAPAILAWQFATGTLGRAAGVGATALAFLALVRLGPDVDARGRPRTDVAR